MARAHAQRPSRFLAAAALVFALGTPAQIRQPSWQARLWAQWTHQEATAVLNDSPWVSNQVLRRDMRIFTDGSGAPVRAFGNISAQFFSALPVRQARIRQMQIDRDYDDLSREQRALFDLFTMDCLQPGAFADRIVVHVRVGGNDHAYRRADTIYEWPGQKNALPAGQAFLLLSGGARLPSLDAERIATPRCGPSDERDFHFVFPRTKNGRPVISEKEKKIAVELAGGLRFEFDLQRLGYGGKTEF